MEQTQQQSKQQKTFYIIRHGETIDNVAQTLQGQKPGKLNEVGIQQAIERGIQMQDYKIDEAWVSDLKRAVDTFDNIHAQMKNKIQKVEHKQIIRERCFGIAEGYTKVKFRELEKQYIEQYGENAEYIPEGSESKKDLENRVQNFIDLLKNWALSDTQSESLLIVSHGMFIRNLLRLLKEFNVKNQEIITDINKYDNVELTEIKFTVNKQDKLIDISYFNRQLLPSQN